MNYVYEIMCMREYKKMKTYKVMKIIKASENILVI